MTLARMAGSFLRRRRGIVAAIVLLQLAQVVFNLWLPSLGADIIDRGILRDDTPFIWRMGGVMFGATLVQIGCSVLAIYLGSRTAMALGRELRAETFRHVQRFTTADRHRFGAPTLVTRTTNDVTQIQMVVLLTFTVIVNAPIMGIGGVVMAIRQDPQLSLLLLLVVPLLLTLILLVMSALSPRHVIQQKRIDRISTLLREQLTGVRVIRAFRRQGAESRKFDEANTQLRSVWLQIGTLWAFLIPATNIIVGLSSAAVVWTGGHRIVAGQMQVGALAAFISYLMMILGAVTMTGMMAMLYPRGQVSAKRIREILDTQPSIAAPEHPLRLPPGPLTFALDHVTLRYPGAEEPVLRDVSLTLAPGTTTAIVGSTGSGKSSVVRLLPRLVDASDGVVTAEGIPLTALDPAELRRRIAVVPQQAFLFSGTVASNVAGRIRPGGEEEERVIKALKAAQAWDFVSEGGIHASIEAGGRNLSGGQRQRLTIARALYRCLPDPQGKRQADLLVFDDSFSALDFATDARIRLSLRDTVGDTTILIVAQRVATVRSSTAILVLDRGGVAGLGTHDELMRNCAPYQEIVASQLSAEEAA